jgi:hypothetical protein
LGSGSGHGIQFGFRRFKFAASAAREIGKIMHNKAFREAKRTRPLSPDWSF